MTFKPSVRACKERGCVWLEEVEYQGRKRKVCNHPCGKGRIPGNIACPKDEMDAKYEAAQKVACPISTGNTRRDIKVSGFEILPEGDA